MRLKKPTAEQLAAIDMSLAHANLNKAGGRTLEFLGQRPGVEPYRLLAYASEQAGQGIVGEVGTLDGCGAVSLANNPNVLVRTYDISPHFRIPKSWPRNVHFMPVSQNVYPGILDADIIYYDAAHEGPDERAFLDFLIAEGWSGTVLWDDIHLSQAMKEFWLDIEQEKEDWTDIGHWSGTGVVYLQKLESNAYEGDILL